MKIEASNGYVVLDVDTAAYVADTLARVGRIVTAEMLADFPGYEDLTGAEYGEDLNTYARRISNAADPNGEMGIDCFALADCFWNALDAAEVERAGPAAA